MKNPKVGVPSRVGRFLDATRFPMIKASDVRRRIAELQMADPLIVEGNLMLWCQEGGFAADACDIGGKYLDDLIAAHFGVERVMPMGHRPIGRVRITVEKLPDANND